MLSKHNNTISELYRSVGRFMELSTGDEWVWYSDFYTDKGVAKAQFTRRFGKTDGKNGKRPIHRTNYNRNTGNYDTIYEWQETYLESSPLNWTRI